MRERTLVYFGSGREMQLRDQNKEVSNWENHLVITISMVICNIEVSEAPNDTAHARHFHTKNVTSKASRIVRNERRSTIRTASCEKSFSVHAICSTSSA